MESGSRTEYKGETFPLTIKNPPTQAQDNQKLKVSVELLNVNKSYFITFQAAINEMGTIENMNNLVKDIVIKRQSNKEASRLDQE